MKFVVYREFYIKKFIQGIFLIYCYCAENVMVFDLLATIKT